MHRGETTALLLSGPPALLLVGSFLVCVLSQLVMPTWLVASPQVAARATFEPHSKLIFTGVGRWDSKVLCSDQLLEPKWPRLNKTHHHPKTFAALCFEVANSFASFRPTRPPTFGWIFSCVCAQSVGDANLRHL